METGNLTPKELRDQDLIEIHKGLFTKLIKENIPSLKNRKIALAFYDIKISIHNIRDYHNHPITVFAKALLSDNLESIVKHQSF